MPYADIHWNDIPFIRPTTTTTTITKTVEEEGGGGGGGDGNKNNDIKSHLSKSFAVVRQVHHSVVL